MTTHPYTRLFILTSAPTVASDAAHGYEKGDVGIYAGDIYDCKDDTNSAAVWIVRGVPRLVPTISPATITADQNDYNPTGLSTATVIATSSDDTTRIITGLSSTGAVNGTIKIIQHSGEAPLVLAAWSAGSSSVNRFGLADDINIHQDESVILRYDGSQWRCIGVGKNAEFGRNSFYIDQSGGTSDTYGTLAGSVNGSNTDFTVSQGNYITSSLKVYLNGQLQTQGTSEDWIELVPGSGTFRFNTAPITGDLITVEYMRLLVSTGNADTVDGLHASSFALATAIRERLTTNRTYYVRTDGSDTNNGLANTAGGAFLTIQKGVDIATNLDNAGYDVTIQIGDGTYTTGAILKSIVGSGKINIQGNSGTPANVLVSVTSAHCFTATAVLGKYVIKDMELRTTTSGNCLVVQQGSTIDFTNLRFGACASYHIECTTGAIVTAIGNYAVTGNAVGHIVAYINSIVNTAGITITYSNSPAFTNWNFYFEMGAALYVYSMTFTNGGTVTGKRYNGIINATCNTNGGGANYIPGNVAGTTATGAQYV